MQVLGGLQAECVEGAVNHFHGFRSQTGAAHYIYLMVKEYVYKHKYTHPKYTVALILAQGLNAGHRFALYKGDNGAATLVVLLRRWDATQRSSRVRLDSTRV